MAAAALDSLDWPACHQQTGEEGMSDAELLFPKHCAQDWEAMEPAGRTRFCRGCSKHVHDLQQYTGDEAVQLVATGRACVRALINPDGQVVTRSGPVIRRLTAAVITPALAAFLVSTPVAAAPSQGVIAGTVGVHANQQVQVTAVAPGIKRTTRTDPQGRYAIDNLPPGTYRLIFVARGAHTWSLPDVPVSADAMTVRDSADPSAPSETIMTIGAPRPPVKAAMGEAIMPPAPVPPS